MLTSSPLAKDFLGGLVQQITLENLASYLNFSPITIYANNSKENKYAIPTISIICQNVTIHRKKKKKQGKGILVDEGDKEILLEASYIPVSKRI